ncbi:hypothetical protein [Saccharococcus caldoxylosilyticus]|uniref:Uncharacterized protein n=1 Tax=Saccharococcus caldoxylosilyticus TaxID=81408 RepID=A0A150LU51_9BACL|nr:hypothetical protein [Parageobacillus caldoxylosilyticus]KYD15767.1 hypothetical protein B4119_2195 [Parageobacillus caldoxylosilyticus]
MLRRCSQTKNRQNWAKATILIFSKRDLAVWLLTAMKKGLFSWPTGKTVLFV